MILNGRGSCILKVFDQHQRQLEITKSHKGSSMSTEIDRIDSDGLQRNKELQNNIDISTQRNGNSKTELFTKVLSHRAISSGNNHDSKKIEPDRIHTSDPHIIAFDKSRFLDQLNHMRSDRSLPALILNHHIQQFLEGNIARTDIPSLCKHVFPTSEFFSHEIPKNENPIAFLKTSATFSQYLYNRCAVACGIHAKVDATHLTLYMITDSVIRQYRSKDIKDEVVKQLNDIRSSDGHGPLANNTQLVRTVEEWMDSSDEFWNLEQPDNRLFRAKFERGLSNFFCRMTPKGCTPESAKDKFMSGFRNNQTCVAHLKNANFLAVSVVIRGNRCGILCVTATREAKFQNRDVVVHAVSVMNSLRGELPELRNDEKLKGLAMNTSQVHPREQQARLYDCISSLQAEFSLVRGICFQYDLALWRESIESTLSRVKELHESFELYGIGNWTVKEKGCGYITIILARP